MSPKNKKKIVAFDSSVLIAIQRNEIDKEFIDKEFPNDTCSRTIQDTVIDEMFFNLNNNWREQDREDSEKLYQDYNFWIMESQHIILLKEYLYDHVLLEKCDLFEEQIKLYFGDTHPEQKAREQLHLILREKSYEAKKETFKKCLTSSSNAGETFSISQFDKELSKLIQENKEFEIPVIDEYLSQLIKKDPIQIAIKGNNTYLKISRINKNSFKYFKPFSDLKESYPTLYNVLLYSYFIDSPKKHAGTQGKDCFHISLNGIKDPIRITENLLPDFRISLPALHYIDEFATCDKGQAQLIKGLFPDYSTKVKYYKKVNENGVEVYKCCSHEI